MRTRSTKTPPPNVGTQAGQCGVCQPRLRTSRGARAPQTEPADADIDAAASRVSERALAEAASIKPANVSPAEARRWAVLMRRICEVEPLVCLKCGGAMREIAPMV